MTAAAGRAVRPHLPLAALAPLLALAILAAPVRAGTEEWSTFDVFVQEQDDESVIDHLLARPPEAWRDEWERSTRAFRTAQGCLTSGQWLEDTDLKLRAPMGRAARFGLDVRDVQDDRGAFTYFDLSLRVPTARFGVPGFWFRPFHDKSRQDFSLFWEAGPETASAGAHLAFTFEDVFNDLWAFRQTRVGDASEPYERHPYEPAIALWARGDRGRLELAGEWLTPSRKRLTPVLGLTPRATLWGAHGRALAELRAGPWRLQAAGENRQALSTEELVTTPAFTERDFRREWSGEAALARACGERLEVEGRWLYLDRVQGAPLPSVPRELAAVDRVIQLEARWRGDRWQARVGGFHDRVGVFRQAGVRSYGTRVESRAYLGLSARFGQVQLSAVEGIELDPEPYDVWFVHDKAFLGIQSTF